MKVLIFSILLSVLVLAARCEHLILGDSTSNRMIHHTIAQYASIPLTKRVKTVFYSSPEQTVINRILAYDNLHSKASAVVTAGGIGHTFVNIRLKSERGKGLDYDIGLYTTSYK